MSFHPFRFDFEDDRKSDSIDFDLSLRAFEVETRSFLESEKDLIHGLTSTLQVRREIDLLDIPTYNPLTGRKEIPTRGLTYGPASVVKVPGVEIKPKGPYDLYVTGSPVSLLSVLGTYDHELVHLTQILHKSMFNAYIQSERAINSFTNIIRKGKDERILRKLIELTEKSKRFNPLNIEEEDKWRLLESVSLVHQWRDYRRRNRALHDIVSKIENEKLEKLLTAFVKCVYESEYHKQAFELWLSVGGDVVDKFPIASSQLYYYLSLFSDYGANDVLKLFERIKNDHNILKYLKELNYSNPIRRFAFFDEIGTDPISNELKSLSFSSYRENILGEINGALEKLDGFSKKRVGMLKEAVERSGKPSQLLNEYVIKWSCIILKDQENRLYPQAVSNGYNPDYVSLMLSFYSDLHICTSILKAANEAFRKGEDPWKAMERAIKCPYRNAPLMGCREKSKCEHEKPWLDAVVER
jgi:hypothetical protein